MSGNMQQLEFLVKSDKFLEAEEYCELAIQEGLNPQVWKTRLGYVLFLNEGVLEKPYEALSVFHELTQLYPHDQNAHLWLGYMYATLYADNEKSRDELDKVLAIDSHHPYANLVIAGFENGIESVQRLQKTLDVQPGNLRALRQLADIFLSRGDIEGAKSILETIVTESPFIESDYEIMNGYINEVLTGSVHANRWKQEAQNLLASL